MSGNQSKLLTRARIGRHVFEVWYTPFGDFQILHYAGKFLIPLHRVERTENRAREVFERVVERYTAEVPHV